MTPETKGNGQLFLVVEALGDLKLQISPSQTEGRVVRTKAILPLLLPGTTVEPGLFMTTQGSVIH